MFGNQTIIHYGVIIAVKQDVNIKKTCTMKKFLILLIISATALLCHSCVMHRLVHYGVQDIYDIDAFPRDTIHRGDTVWCFAEQDMADRILDHHRINWIKLDGVDTLAYRTMDSVLRCHTSTVAVIVVQNDTIKFEHYYKGLDTSSVTTIFSVSKSLTSMLCGVAVREGYIKSVHDPVTDYITELKDADPMFQKLTVEHLLNMRAGLKFKETYAPNPFTAMARLYYGANQEKQIRNLKFKEEPGSNHYYSSMVTAILGVLIERATGRSYAEYMEEKIWKPLGMEYDAYISLDDEKHRSPKAYGGINTCARDLAKIGRLYLNMGNWNGVQILDTAWVEKSRDKEGMSAHYAYSYGWYPDEEYIERADTSSRRFPDSLSVAARFDELDIPDEKRNYYFYDGNKNTEGHWEGSYMTGGYMAVGILGQTIHVLPQYNAVIVCLSESYSMDDALVTILRRYPGLSWSDIEKEKSGKSDNNDDEEDDNG
mgnify:CR=1 FL=1